VQNITEKGNLLKTQGISNLTQKYITEVSGRKRHLLKKMSPFGKMEINIDILEKHIFHNGSKANMDMHYIMRTVSLGMDMCIV